MMPLSISLSKLTFNGSLAKDQSLVGGHDVGGSKPSPDSNRGVHGPRAGEVKGLISEEEVPLQEIVF